MPMEKSVNAPEDLALPYSVPLEGNFSVPSPANARGIGLSSGAQTA